MANYEIHLINGEIIIGEIETLNQFLQERQLEDLFVELGETIKINNPMVIRGSDYVSYLKKSPDNYIVVRMEHVLSISSLVADK